ncbi:protein rhomboid-like [Bradysia coprophila]|uniref:protein rhomboid-like n=1 Tax=Bradysia coprophila TaxID=38358 RepID=UPI00187D7EA6|nr:protein rhomboid-like [Bradysia coprophila]
MAKICTFAEDVVLPKNERDSLQAAKNVELSMRNIEAQHPHPSTARLYSDRDESKYFPIFMVVITLIQITVFYSVDEGLMLLLFGYDPHRRHEIWRFFTMMFVHASPSHLWHNAAMQVSFGGLLEIIHSWKRIGLIYVASVFGGSLFISVLDNVYTVGASSGVYGLAFAHLATITLNWNEMDKKCCGLFSWSISHAGHLGGAVTGFLVSILVLKNFKVEKWERLMQKICTGLLIGICGIIFIVNVAAPGYYVPIEWNFQYSHTYLEDYIHQVNNDSVLMHQCEIDADCKQLLDQYNFNGTIALTELT